ncbi:glutathione peroxidase [Seminavis robusta]|uniref:Glutathione peroxidase n=1 Tax=Seminavis robusta TaxID=568900 RepID=A0A9N8E558_9STRA|nr:glutathione peroxidase [Seminavis robusta]|eukprot:Sro671_g184790.1 glutathione peroxidase (161) ;mRNA; f:4340-4894
MMTGRRLVLGLLATLLLLATTTEAIYPVGHWDHCTEITSSEQLDTLIDSTLEAGQTLFAFAGNNNVRFADINLRETPIRGPPYNPGQGGWPTIRYFNNATGKEGAPYQKKMADLPMCKELGDFDRMTAYIEEAGNTKLEEGEDSDDSESESSEDTAGDEL